MTDTSSTFLCIGGQLFRYPSTLSHYCSIIFDLSIERYFFDTFRGDVRGTDIMPTSEVFDQIFRNSYFCGKKEIFSHKSKVFSKSTDEYAIMRANRRFGGEMSKKNAKILELINALAKEGHEINEVMAMIKPLFRRLDEITLELIELGITSEVTDSYKINVLDNYSDKNTNFKVAAFKRFDLRIEELTPTISSLRKRLKKDVIKKVRVKTGKPTVKKKIDPFKVRKN